MVILIKGDELEQVDEYREANAKLHAGLEVDTASAYDFLQSLRILNRADKKGRWQSWAIQTLAHLELSQKQALQRWFGSDFGLGTAFVALVPLLPLPRGAAELIQAVTDLELADFLRIVLVDGPTAQDTPLDAQTLLSLTHSKADARAFVDRHLSFTGKLRSLLLHILADPQTMRNELVNLLQLYHEQIWQQFEPELQDEREQAATSIRAILAEHPNPLPDWLSGLETLQGFDPLVVTPSVFGDFVYIHEVQHSLLSSKQYEPLILAVNTQRVLEDAPRAKRKMTAPVASSDPAERWAKLFDVLADSSRLRLLHLLAEQPRYGQELEAALNLSGATISHHMTLLARAGLVRLERRSHRTYFVLQTSALNELLSKSQEYILRK